MLEDKYQGSQQFVQSNNSNGNDEMKQKLDQIHKILCDTYEFKVKNINQGNVEPSPAQKNEIQTNEIVQQQNVEPKSQQQQVLEDDYVNQFQVQQKQQEVQKQQQVQGTQVVDGFQQQEVIQANADLSSSELNGNFQVVQSSEQQLSEQHHQHQQHQQQQHIEHQRYQQQQQLKEKLQKQYVHLPTNIPQSRQNKELQAPLPYHENSTNYAQFNQQGQQIQQQQSVQKKQYSEEILGKQKKDDINILIILIIFAIIFLF